MKDDIINNMFKLFKYISRQVGITLFNITYYTLYAKYPSFDS